MDEKRLESLTRGDAAERTGYDNFLLGGIQAYASGEAPYFDAYLDRDALDALLKTLRLKTFDGARVEAFYLTNTEGGNVDIDGTEDVEGAYPGKWTLDKVFMDIADHQNIWADEVNSFKATVLIRYDAKTVAAFGMEQWTAIHVCGDCIKLAETDEVQAINNTAYSCEHLEDEYPSKYWFGIFDAAEIEQRGSWMEWDLEDFDQPEQVEKAGVRDGRFELLEAEMGEVIRITTIQGDKQFVYDFTVIEPGEYPLCDVVLLNPDGTKVFYPRHMLLEGGGRITTRMQNPVQHQDEALTVSYGNLYQGSQTSLFDIEREGRELGERTVLKPVTTLIELIKNQDGDALEYTHDIAHAHNMANVVEEACKAAVREYNVAESYEHEAETATDPVLRETLARYALGYKNVVEQIVQATGPRIARLEADYALVNDTDS